MASRRNFMFNMLLLCGDIMENPGPTSTIAKKPPWKFPYGVCKKPIKINQKGICCDSCDRWFHTRCCGVGDHMFNILLFSSCTWICCDCGFPNFSASFFDSSAENVESENSFAVLNTTSESNISKNSDCETSKPKRKAPHHQNKQTRANETRPLKVAVVNCDGISGLKSNADFRCFLDHHKPDIILVVNRNSMASQPIAFSHQIMWSFEKTESRLAAMSLLHSRIYTPVIR